LLWTGALLHLKFFDRNTMEGVAEARKTLVCEADKQGTDGYQEHPWNRTLGAYEHIIATTTLEGEDIKLPEFRAAMQNQVEKYNTQYVWGRSRSDKLYRIPERFADIF